jgi:hypothetical protein
MARKKVTKNKLIISEEIQEKSCIDYLRERGYGIFRLENELDVEEAESVRKLQQSGYKVEHINDSLVKVDTRKITSADDIVLYFYEKLKRLGEQKIDPQKLSDPKHRLVDCSVVNTFIKWRTSSAGTSLREAIEELFIAIDILFEKKNEWKADIHSLGILSTTHNKSFVVSLLREVHLRQDQQLTYDIANLINKEDLASYPSMLSYSKTMMSSTKTKPIKPKRRPLRIGDLHAKKK